MCVKIIDTTSNKENFQSGNFFGAYPAYHNKYICTYVAYASQKRSALSKELFKYNNLGEAVINCISAIHVSLIIIS